MQMPLVSGRRTQCRRGKDNTKVDWGTAAAVQRGGPPPILFWQDCFWLNIDCFCTTEFRFWLDGMQMPLVSGRRTQCRRGKDNTKVDWGTAAAVQRGCDSAVQTLYDGVASVLYFQRCTAESRQFCTRTYRIPATRQYNAPFQ